MKIKKIKKSVDKLIMDSTSYLKESKNYIWFILGLFFVGSLIGFFFSSYFTFLDEMLRELILQTQDLKGIDMIIFIFNNNIKSAFFGMVFGVLLGIVPLINSLFNGLVLGYVMNLVWAVSGFSDFWRILPHGVFELPAIFIALGTGLRLGFFVFSKDRKKELIRRFKGTLGVFFVFVLPLLVIAAIIEGLLINILR